MLASRWHLATGVNPGRPLRTDPESRPRKLRTGPARRRARTRQTDDARRPCGSRPPDGDDGDGDDDDDDKHADVS